MSKIAFLTPFLPYPADTGGKIRSYQILRQLAAHHDVHVVTVHGEPWDKAVAHIETLVTDYTHIHAEQIAQHPMKKLFSLTPDHVAAFVSPQAIERVQAFVREGNFDIVLADEIVMAPYVDMSIEALRVLALQNIDYQLRLDMFRQQSIGREKLRQGLEYLRLRAFSWRMFRQPWDKIIVCSESDRNILKKTRDEHDIYIMPNGVDTDFYHVNNPPDDTPPTLIFVGSMFYYPNIDAMNYFFDAIYPRITEAIKPLQVYIVGHHPPPDIQALEASYPHVTVTGSVDDVRPYLEKSHAVIVPLRLGGGTSLKVVEGIATGRPVISTGVGCRGLELQPEQDLLVRNNAQTFAQGVIDVLTNEPLRDALIENGRDSVQRYDWRVLTAGLRENLESSVQT